MAGLEGESIAEQLSERDARGKANLVARYGDAIADSLFNYQRVVTDYVYRRDISTPMERVLASRRAFAEAVVGGLKSESHEEMVRGIEAILEYIDNRIMPVAVVSGAALSRT